MRLFASVDGLVDRLDRPFSFGLPFDLAYAVTIVAIPDEPGLEFTLPENRLHFTMPENLLGYALPANRLHYTIPGEQ